MTLNLKELKRLQVLQEVEAGRMTAGQAAEITGLSLRQMRRIIAKYRERGVTGLVHGNRGCTAHNRLSEEVRAKIVELAEGKYHDYNDSHFTDELGEAPHGLQVSRSTVRRIRRTRGLGSPHKRRSARHRRRRERKAQAGMLLQTDGSRHDWLEGRGPWLTLIAYIDDATNEVLNTFLPKHNSRFRVKAEQPGSAYVPWPQTYDRQHFFCFKHQRTVTNDNTIPFDGHRLQIPPGPQRRSYAKARVAVWQHLDGRLEIRYQDQSLISFQPATQEPVRIGKFSPAPLDPIPTSTPQPEYPPSKPRQPHKPAPDHPWRRYPASSKSP